MIWTKLNDSAWYAEYCGWHVTKNFLYQDIYGKDKFEFIATKDAKRFTSASWEFIKTRILKTKEQELF